MTAIECGNGFGCISIGGSSRAWLPEVKTSPPSYAPTVFEEVVVYEFYMPLSHEGPLKVTLDTFVL